VRRKKDYEYQNHRAAGWYVSTKKLPKRAGSTKFKSHIASTVDKIINSGTPIKENSQTATPPRITTSKMKNVGTMETKKYIVKISGIDTVSEIGQAKVIIK